MVWLERVVGFAGAAAFVLAGAVVFYRHWQYREG